MEIDVAFAMLLTVLAGLSTGIGSTIALFIKTPKYSYLAILLGFSAGVMIYISFTELLGTAIQDVGFTTANIAFFIGILLIAAIDILVPHEYEEEYANSSLLSINQTGQQEVDGSSTPLTVQAKSSLTRSGVLLAIGIAIHNFPEGMVTFTSAATGNTTFGIMIAIAIALHNIPEGIAISVPLYYASGSHRRAFIYSFLAGIAEPVGAIIAYAILLPFLTEGLLSGALAFVAGIMVYISLDEILPLAHRYGRGHLVIIGAITGMLVMTLSIFLLR